jgi:uncharacterized lipoprotein
MRLPLALLIPLSGGCFFMDVAEPMIGSGAGDWLETGAVLRPRDELLQAAREAAFRQGYRVPETETRPEGFTTDWITSYSSHWREGHRTRLQVEAVPAEPRGINVRIRSFREFNDEARQPMVPEKAQWRGAATDEKQKQKVNEPALRLRQVLKLKYFGIPND